MEGWAERPSDAVSTFPPRRLNCFEAGFELFWIQMPGSRTVLQQLSAQRPTLEGEGRAAAAVLPAARAPNAPPAGGEGAAEIAPGGRILIKPYLVPA